MNTKQQGSFLGKRALFASAASVSFLVTTTTSTSPIAPGFDLFSSNDALRKSLAAAPCSPAGGGTHCRYDWW